MISDLPKTVRKVLRSVATNLREFAYAPRREPEKSVSRPRIGLALGGGFARGVAHIGVLKVFSENGVPVDAIAGVSAGGIVAALFASGLQVDEMIELAGRIRWSRFARWTIPRLGFATNERMEEMLREMLPCSRFEELSMPLAVVATDISTGEAVVFKRGELIPALRASCTVPGLFAPVEFEGRLLVDGAILGVPVAPLHGFEVDRIVAVSLKVGQPRHAPNSIFEVVGQALQISESRSAASWRSQCYLTIEPDVSDFKWDDFDRVEELILAGEQAARRALPALRTLLAPGEMAAREAVAVRWPRAISSAQASGG